MKIKFHTDRSEDDLPDGFHDDSQAVFTLPWLCHDYYCDAPLERHLNTVVIATR